MRRSDWDCLPLLREAVARLKEDHGGEARVEERAGALVFVAGAGEAGAAPDAVTGDCAWTRVMDLCGGGSFNMRAVLRGVATHPAQVPHLELLLKRLQGRAGFKFLRLDSASGRYTSYFNAPGASRVQYDVGMVTEDVKERRGIGVALGGLHFGRTVEECLRYIGPGTASADGGHGVQYVVAVVSVPDGAECSTDGVASAAASLKTERLVWVDECSGVLSGRLATGGFLLDGIVPTEANIAAFAALPPASSAPAAAAALHNMVRKDVKVPWSTVAACLDKFGMYVGLFALCVEAVERHGFPGEDALEDQVALGAAFAKHRATTSRHHDAFSRVAPRLPIRIP